MIRRRSFICFLLLAAFLTACSTQATNTPLSVPSDQAGVSTDNPPSEAASTVVPPEVTEDEPEAAQPPQAPTPEPPGDPSPSQSRMQLGDELVIQTIAMIDARVGWAIGGPGNHWESVLRTEDGGLTWREVSPAEIAEPSNPIIAVGAFLDLDTAWIAYHSEGDPQPGGTVSLNVWRTDDAGQNWRSSSPQSIEFIGSRRAQAWVSFVDEEKGWLLARYGGAGMHKYPVYLLHSEDGGAYWEVLEDPYQGLWLQSCPKTGWDWFPPGTGVITLGLCPFESTEILVTEDSGYSWANLRLPFPEGEQERFGFSSCAGHSPIILSPREVLIASECPLWGDEPETVNLLYRTTDLGASWQIQEYPGGALHRVSDSVILALGKRLYRSVDAGLTWTLVKQVSWEGQFSFVDPQHGWAVARADEEIALVRTSDGGETWQLIEPVLVP